MNNAETYLLLMPFHLIRAPLHFLPRAGQHSVHAAYVEDTARSSKLCRCDEKDSELIFRPKTIFLITTAGPAILSVAL